MLYVIVPTYNREEICKHFINDLKSQSNQDFILILVDHGKKKVNLEDNNDQIVYIPSDVNGWARAVNVGLRYVLKVAGDSDYTLIINDDVILEKSYIQTIYDSIQKKPMAVLGTCCIDKNTNQTLRISIKLNRLKAVHDYLFQYIDVSELPGVDFLESDVLTGKGTVFPIKMLQKIGIYNEEKLPHYKADHELVWRAKKLGYEVYASTKMQLRTLSDQKVANGKESLINTIKFFFYDMRSTMRLRDWWNYAILAYSKPYALYFFSVNTFCNIVRMLYTWLKTK